MADQFAALVPEFDAGVVGGQPLPVPIGTGLSGPQQVVTATATMVEAPIVPQRPVSPVPARNLALGLLAGVLLGVALAVVRDKTDRTVRRTDALAAASGLPVLARLPETSAPNRRAGEPAAAQNRPTSHSMRRSVVCAPDWSARAPRTTAPF